MVLQSSPQPRLSAVARKQAALDAVYYTGKMKSIKDKIEKTANTPTPAASDPAFIDKRQRNELK